MYKRFTLDELRTINTGFFTHLKSIVTKHQHTYFKEFFLKTMEESERAYFFQSSKPLFRIQKLEEGKYRFVDEQDKIEVIASDKDVQALHNILGDTGVMKSMTKNQTIMDQIISEYQAGERDTIAGKPYVVYDIETTFDGPQLTNQHFEMAYSIASDDPHEESLPYKYIDRTSMKKYCDRLLAYDGWIVGYNQIGFDNPVLCMNVGYGEKEIEILNRKSLDPFLFLWKTLGRRISLNNASKALISSGKTLSSGKEGEELLKEYKRTGEEKFLRKVKKYCKNDVHITLGVLLALIKQKKIFVENKMYEFTLKDIIHKGAYVPKGEPKDRGPARLV